MKKSCIALLVALMVVTGVSVVRTPLNAEENDGCYVLNDGTIVCEEDIPEGCYFDISTNSIECGLDPQENVTNPGTKG